MQSQPGLVELSRNILKQLPSRLTWRGEPPPKLIVFCLLFLSLCNNNRNSCKPEKKIKDVNYVGVLFSQIALPDVAASFDLIPDGATDTSFHFRVQRPRLSTDELFKNLIMILSRNPQYGIPRDYANPGFFE